MMSRFFIFSLVSLAFVNCSIQKPKDFTLSYSQNNTGLDKLIDIDGYYLSQRACDSIFFSAFMFYPDGLFCIVTGTKLDEATKCFNNNDQSTLCKNLLWGLYEIKNDTIKTQTLRQEGLEYYVIHRDYLITKQRSLINLSEYVNTENTNVGYLKNYPSFYINKCPIETMYLKRSEEKREQDLCPLLSNKWF